MLEHPLSRDGLTYRWPNCFYASKSVNWLSSIVLYDESSGKVEIQHTSFVDFWSDKHRSNGFYIDMASMHTDFVCRTLQWVKGPDGIRGTAVLRLYFDTSAIYRLFQAGIRLGLELRSDILNFDFDAFITAVVRHQYN